jgi:hypothetical protein
MRITENNLEEIAAALVEATNETRPLRPRIKVLVKQSLPADKPLGQYVAICVQYSVIAHADSQFYAVIGAMENLLHHLAACKERGIHPVNYAHDDLQEAYDRGIPLELPKLAPAHVAVHASKSFQFAEIREAEAA